MKNPEMSPGGLYIAMSPTARETFEALMKYSAAGRMTKAVIGQRIKTLIDKAAPGANCFFYGPINGTPWWGMSLKSGVISDIPDHDDFLLCQGRPPYRNVKLTAHGRQVLVAHYKHPVNKWPRSTSSQTPTSGTEQSGAIVTV